MRFLFSWRFVARLSGLALACCVCAAQGPPGGVVSGKAVMAGSDTPVRGTVLRAKNELFEFPKVVASASEDGTFVVRDLTPGTHYLAFQPNSITAFSPTGMVMVEMTAGEERSGVVFEVEEGCAIRGRVVDADSNGVADQEVVVQSGGTGHQVAKTSAQGRFSILHIGPAEQVYQLGTYDKHGVPVTVTTGPVAAGKVIENVILQLPPEREPRVVRGVVVDPSGTPVRCTFSLRAPQSRPAHTDINGQFRVTTTEPGTYPVYVNLMLRLGNSAVDTGCEVISGAPITVDGDREVTEARLVVQPFEYVRGKVLDEGGEPLRARIDTLSLSSHASVTQGDRNEFAVTDLPNGPFLLQVVQPGYIPRILEADREFGRNDRDLTVTLRKGPLAPDEDIFMAVTGLPPEGDIARQRVYDMVRQREVDYRQLAEPPEAASAPAEPQPPAAWHVRVTDAQGVPVRGIYMQPSAWTLYGVGRLTRETALATPREASQWMESETGVYIAEPGALIWAKGMGKAFLSAPPSAEETQIILEPAGRIELQVEDSEGRPISGAKAIQPNDVSFFQSYNFEGPVGTNAQGTLAFADLAPGLYAYRVVLPQPIRESGMQPPLMYPLPVVFRVTPGAVCRREIVLPRPEDDTPEGWLAKAVARPASSRLQGEKLPELPRRIRDKVATLVADGLTALPGAEPWEERDAESLAYIALDAKLKETVPALRALLGRWSFSDGTIAWRGDASQALSRALATFDGNGAVDDFARWAADPARPYAVRRDAVIALGQIGTKESLNAYRLLRSAARNRPGAPTPVSNPTQAQQMAEAVDMAFATIPEQAGGMTVALSTAQVSMLGGSGTIHYAGGNAGMTVELRCLDGDWMVVGFKDVFQV